jgi:DNA-binding transcriptional regulator YiaG
MSVSGNMEGLDEALAAVRLRRRLPAPSVRRHLRERAGITQTHIAGVLGVDSGTVSRWESGRRHPRAESLRRYLDVLDKLAAESLR